MSTVNAARANLQASFTPAVRCRRLKNMARGKMVYAFSLPAKFVDVSHATQAQGNIRRQFATVFGN
jgi:hypothetical protein